MPSNRLDLITTWKSNSIPKLVLLKAQNMRVCLRHPVCGKWRLPTACTVLFLFLSGCTLHIESAPRDTQFNLSSQDSLVILGSRIEEKHCAVLENYIVFFANYDPATKIINGSFSNRKEYGDRVQCQSLFKTGCTCKGVHWHLYRVPAGEHALLSLGTLRYGGNYMTVFTKADFHSLGRRAIMGDKIYGFRTEPGKAYYLGNFVFDVASFPARIVQYYRDDDGLRAHLKDHPNVIGDVEYIKINLPEKNSR